MRAAAAALVLAVAGCGGGGAAETVVRREPPPPPTRVDLAVRYAYVLVPEYARLRRAYVGWLIPCVYIKETAVCIERNAAVAAAARRVVARLGEAPPSLRRGDLLLRRGLASLARAAERQRRLLLAGDERGYLNSFSPFLVDALPDVTNGIGEVRAVVPGAELPLLSGLSVSEARAELRSP